MKSRRVVPKIIYNGSDISNNIESIEFCDTFNMTDDITISILDTKEEWLDSKFPNIGDSIVASVKLENWAENSIIDIEFGNFEVDSISFGETMQITGVSTPINSTIRTQKNSKAFENITLIAIAQEIASKNGLNLEYKASRQPLYDRIEQKETTDMDFLDKLCQENGFYLKVYKKKLVILEQSIEEQKSSVFKIEKNKSDLVSKPSFSHNSMDIYKDCKVTFNDPKTDKLYTGYFLDPKSKASNTLKSEEQYNSKHDDFSMNILAKNRLRNANKNEWQASFSLFGNGKYFAGTNIDIVGWGKFDGKYFVEQVKHNFGNGYTVNLDTRRCLDGY